MDFFCFEDEDTVPQTINAELLLAMCQADITSNHNLGFSASYQLPL